MFFRNNVKVDRKGCLPYPRESKLYFCENAEKGICRMYTFIFNKRLRVFSREKVKNRPQNFKEKGKTCQLFLQNTIYIEDMSKDIFE
jgi:hypothetical protein